MKVGILLTPYGEKKPSGLGAYVLNLSLELIKQNPNWEFYLCIKGRHDVSVFDDFDNIVIKYLPNTFLWKDIAYTQNKEVDVWLYNNPNLPLIFKPKLSILTALDFGVFYQDNDLNLLGKFRQTFAKFLQHQALKKAGHVLCTSKATKQDLHTFFPDVNEEKVTVAMCGFTRICEVYQPAEMPNLPEIFYLLVGVIKPRKNQLTAVKAFIQAKEKGLKGRLVISGKGDNQYFKELMKTISGSTYKEDIVYLGYVKNEELVTLFKKARALIFPSHVEGFGMPIVEAMSCGTPVVASNNGAQGEVAEGHTLTTDSRDVDGFTEALLKIEDDNLRAELIEKGKVRSSEFSWEKSAHIYTEILEKIYSK